jgi:hypothetical protein
MMGQTIFQKKTDTPSELIINKNTISANNIYIVSVEDFSSKILKKIIL